MNLILCTFDPEIVACWRREFAGCADVECREGDLTDVEADAYVSAANSFGVMDGGVDLALRERFGQQLEDTVREAIAKVGPLLPVGQALVVSTEDLDVPYLVVAPTMEVPMRVSHTRNAHLAFRAALHAVAEFNDQEPDAILVLAAPGMATGVGGMEPAVAAEQMAAAYREFLADIA